MHLNAPPSDLLIGGDEDPLGLVRPAIRDLVRYVPGRRTGPHKEYYKLSQNESAYAPLAGVLDAAMAACHSLNRYPDMAATRLTEALSDHLDVPTAQLTVGTGSVGVLQQLMQSVLRRDEEVIFAWRSFEAYRTLTSVVGGRAVTIPLTADERHDLPAMAAAVTPRTRLILLCTPNNPTGTAITAEDLERFLAQVPGHVLVVLDEAYMEFVRDPAVVSGLALRQRYPNLVVLRTFSKAHGLAGLRVGYAITSEQLADAARKTAVPFGVSTIAQQAAIASLARMSEVHDRIRETLVAREELRAELIAQGWVVPHSEANFLWLRLGDASAAFAEASAEAGVIVRPYGNDGVRVTIGEPAALRRFGEIASAWRLAHP